MNGNTPSFHSSCIVAVLKQKKKLFGCALLAMIAAPSLVAQSSAAAVRSLSISTFATGGLTNTDYGRTDYGFTFGTDLRRPTGFVQPSLEIRSTMTSGNSVRQRTLNGGLKLEKGFGRIHPYGDLLLGYGTITFPDNTIYPRDSSTVWTYGGGVEYQVSRSFLMKADAQLQSWQLGQGSPIFRPTLMSAGFTYRPMMRGIVR